MVMIREQREDTQHEGERLCGLHNKRGHQAVEKRKNAINNS